MTKDQAALMRTTELGIPRARELSNLAEQLGMNVLASFWKEVAEMLEKSVDYQKRAFRSGGLFDEVKHGSK